MLIRASKLSWFWPRLIWSLPRGQCRYLIGVARTTTNRIAHLTTFDTCLIGRTSRCTLLGAHSTRSPYSRKNKIGKTGLTQLPRYGTC